MTDIQRRVVRCAVGFIGLLAMAVMARRVAMWGFPDGVLRLIMLVFILACPVLLGMTIGVWGGERGAVWGGRGVALTYLAVVAWAWSEDGVFPVGFQFHSVVRHVGTGFQVPMLLTLTNVVIFLVTLYFMRALGMAGGRLGASVGRSQPTVRRATPEEPTILRDPDGEAR